MFSIYAFNNAYVYPKLKDLIAINYVVIISDWLFWICLGLTSYLAYLDPGFVKPERDEEDYFLKLLITNEPQSLCPHCNIKRT